MEVEHSRLLKFFKSGRSIKEMAELPVIKIQKDYESPPNVESEVPGTHKMREVDENSLNNTENSKLEIGGAQFTLSPVITVTQKESTLTKDGVKSHKMTVTEDIAMGDTENGRLRVSSSLQQDIEVVSRSSRTQIRKEKMDNQNMERDKSLEDKKSKIPIKRLRQAVEKVKKERKDQKERERQQNLPRRSSLPKLKESKIPTKRHTSLKLDPKTEDEFEKIYEEIVDNKLKDIDDKILEVKIEDTEIVESKFEEIIHAYDEDVEEKPTISRISKIPALRRRDEDRTSKIGALVDKVKAKTPTADSELKDGGFRVTASNITIKRFSRGTSRDLNQENAITVAKESVDSESTDKTTKTAPVKPARTYRRKNSEKDNFKYEAVEKNDIANDSIQAAIKEPHVVTPVKPERVRRGVSREVKKDDRGTVVIEKFEDNNSKTEIITTKSEGDGTITKTTTIEREVHSGIPIRTERLIRSFSQGVNKEKPVTEKVTRHYSSKTGEEKIINESTEENKESISTNKKESTKDSVTPVKPERFTRGISREMGNIRLKDDSDILRDFRETGSHNIVKKITSKESVTKDSNSEVIKTEEIKEQIGNTIKETFVTETVIEETTSKIDDSISKEVVTDENGIRKETLQTEYLIKEGIKVGIPVFTKTTENSSESNIENIESSSTDEVKSYIRSASENITRTELKDSSWKRTPSFIKDTNVNNKETVTNKYTSSVSMQEGFKSNVTENVSSSVTVKKVTEYQTKEEKINVEMNTYMLRNPFDFSIKRDAYDFKNENVKKTELKQDKNEIKETTESTTAKESSESVIADAIEKKETEHVPVPTDEKDSDTEEVTVLKGNVSRLKSKISSIGNAKTTKQEDIGLPRSTSVSSKIAVFERLESGESISKEEKLPEISTPELETNAVKVEEKPKIVEELLKFDSNDERDKIKIGFNYDEVVYMTEAKIVDEFWKSAEGNDDNVSTVNPVINNIPKTQTKESGDDIEPITPEIVTINSVKTIHLAKDTPNDKQTEIATTLPLKIGNKTIDNQFEVARPLPGLKNDNRNETDKVIEPIEDKTYIKPNYYELPKILPDKDYETQIGKTKPGKINLNIWKTQVAVNKTLVDKKGIIKNENVEEIAKTLPDKLSFNKNHIQVSKVLPETVDFKEKVEVAKTLPAIINFNIDEARNVPTIVPGNLHYKTNASEFEKDTIFDDKDNLSVIDVETKHSETYISEPIIEIESIPVNQLEPPKIPPPNIPDKDSYKSQYMDTSKKDTKHVPGKINLNLWKNQVETNKTLLSKKHVKSKDFEFPKTFNKHTEISKPGKSTSNYETQKSVPSKVSVISTEVETPRALPAKVDFTPENKVQPIRTLPAFIDVKASENEPFRTLPGFININTSKPNEQVSNKDVNIVTVGEAKTFPATIELKASESQVEEPKNLIGYTDFKESVYNEKYSTSTISNISVSTIESNTSEQPKSLPGKLDLRAWETQVEVNKTLLGTITSKDDNTIEIIKQIETDTSDSENNDEDFKETADFLPANNDFTIINTSQINTINLGDTIAENSSPDEESVEENDLNNNTTIAVTTDLEPKESLSDPELVIDEPELKERKASIMNRIRNKLYFINYKNIVRNTAIKNLAAEKEANSSNTGHLSTKTNAVDSQDLKEEIDTANTEFKETNVFIEETYQKIVKEYTSKQIINKTNTNINKNEDYSNVTENNYSKRESVTEESSKYGIKSDFNEEFRRNREEMKRAKSVAELDLGDAVNGKVQQILSRIKSVDFDRRSSVKVEKINIKEMPKKMSVLEKIALFEALAKQTTFKNQILIPQAVCPSHTRLRVKETEHIAILQGKGVTQSTIQPVTTKTVNSEEMVEKKIEGLKAAKEKYGSIDKMPVLTLSGSQSMPIIAFGTALADPQLLPHLIKAAIDLGYRAFDTAYIYGNEKEIGQAINEKIQDGTVKREDLFIMSKLWSTFHRQDLVETACRSSLKNMGLDYFDLYMIHNPMSFKEGPDPVPKIASVVQYSDHDYLEAWYGMEGLVSGGLARSIGVSNFNTQQLQRILDKGRIAPAVNQVECHPYLSQERLHAFCTERNITLSCFGVLGSKGTPAELKNSTTAVIDDPLVKVMASGLNVTPAQLLIRYQIEYGHNVVVKASSAEHLWDNLQALTFSLDTAQVAALLALNKNRRTFTFQGMGDTHKNYPFTNGN